MIKNYWQVSYQHSGNHQIISSASFYVCIKLSLIGNSVVLQKGSPFRFLVNSGSYSRKPAAKIGDFALRKKEERKKKQARLR